MLSQNQYEVLQLLGLMSALRECEGERKKKKKKLKLLFVQACLIHLCLLNISYYKQNFCLNSK